MVAVVVAPLVLVLVDIDIYCTGHTIAGGAYPVTVGGGGKVLVQEEQLQQDIKDLLVILEMALHIH